MDKNTVKIKGISFTFVSNIAKGINKLKKAEICLSGGPRVPCNLQSINTYFKQRIKKVINDPLNAK